MEGRETGELRKLAYGGCVRWSGREQESKLGGEKGENDAEWGREREGKVPGRIFFEIFFENFHFGWLRFNHFHPMVEKKWRHGTEGGIVDFS